MTFAKNVMRMMASSSYEYVQLSSATADSHRLLDQMRNSPPCDPFPVIFGALASADTLYDTYSFNSLE